MKRVFLSILLASVILISCKKKNNSGSLIRKQDEPIEIEFIKQGELWLKNGDKILKKLDIEFATTSTQQAQGLMYRSFMKENRGMLFIFEENQKTSFWMKNTRIVLDIISIKEDGTVLNVTKNAIPFSKNKIEPSQGLVKFVLEVNGGMADKWGVKEGLTKIELERSYTD